MGLSPWLYPLIGSSGWGDLAAPLERPANSDRVAGCLSHLYVITPRTTDTPKLIEGAFLFLS